MGDFTISFDQPHMAGPMPTQLECYNDKTKHSIEATSRQPALTKNALKSLSPPVNFSMVSEGLYRSGYPQVQDYPFMQTLKLKTIVTLVKKELPDGYEEFIRMNGITHKIFDMSGTKKEEIPIRMMRTIYAVVSNPENYPLLIHCNHGKHRTGCVVGVLRKVNRWDLKHILDEYRTFAEPKVRETDIKYLSEFKLSSLWRQPREVSVPSTSRFVRFVVASALAAFVFYNLGELRI